MENKHLSQTIRQESELQIPTKADQISYNNTSKLFPPTITINWIWCPLKIVRSVLKMEVGRIQDPDPSLMEWYDLVSLVLFRLANALIALKSRKAPPSHRVCFFIEPAANLFFRGVRLFLEVPQALSAAIGCTSSTSCPSGS